MDIILWLIACLVGVGALPYNDIINEQWRTFKMTHRKSYKNKLEEKFRMKIYYDNLRRILDHNQNYAQGFVNYKLCMNQYGDMLYHEIIAKMNGYNKTVDRGFSASGDDDDTIIFIPPANVEFPISVDWRQDGAVTEVKDQRSCGSCWSFSATGALEGQHFRRTGKLVSLSEQNLIDCSTKYRNLGCDGGYPFEAFRYIRDNRGIDTAKSYPYEARNDICRYKMENSGATDAGYAIIQPGNEDHLMAAVATIGPMSVAIDASHKSFHFYCEGVYNEPKCSDEELDHAVLVVGYGTSENGSNYWLVKNSWGTSWGEKGYIKMIKNQDNQCGIASQASYPLV